MTGMRRAANGWGPAGVRQVCGILGAAFAGGEDRLIGRAEIARGTSHRMDLGGWARCAAGVSPDQSN